MEKRPIVTASPGGLAIPASRIALSNAVIRNN